MLPHLFTIYHKTLIIGNDSTQFTEILQNAINRFSNF